MSDLLEVVAYTAAGEPRARAVKLPSEPFDGRSVQRRRFMV